MCLPFFRGLTNSFLGLLLFAFFFLQRQSFNIFFAGFFELVKKWVLKEEKNYHIHGLSLLCKQICTLVFVADFGDNLLKKMLKSFDMSKYSHFKLILIDVIMVGFGKFNSLSPRQIVNVVFVKKWFIQLVTLFDFK